MKSKKWLSLCVAVALLMSLLGAVPAHSADAPLTNYSFEDGLTGWTQNYGIGGITSSTEIVHSGSKSLKIVDDTSTSSKGMESGFISAAPNQIWMVYAWGYMIDGSADVYLRYWDSNKKLISSAFGGKSTPLNQWNYFKIKGTTPANTAYVTALLYSNGPNVGTIYFDDVYITQDFTDLGVQVTNQVAHGYAFGTGTHSDKAYLVVDGASMAEVDLNTETMTKSIPLPNGPGGGWTAAMASDGNVYMGTFSGGRVYKHVPGTNTVTDLGQALPGISFVYGMSVGTNGTIYAGSYPKSKFFKYNPSTGFTQIGSSPIWGTEEYVGDTAYDAVNDVSYLGIGTHAALVRYKHSNGTKVNILPSQYADQEMVYDVAYTGGKVFARVTQANKLLVLDVQDIGGTITTTIDATVDNVGSRGVTPESDGRVYFTVNSDLMYYDIATKTLGSLINGTVGWSPSKVNVVQLADQTNYPGKTVVGFGVLLGQVRMFKYNLQNQTMHIMILNGLPTTPTGISELATGPDGKIYAAGTFNGGMGVYTPMRSDYNVEYKGTGQAESMFSYNGKLYISTYPSAKFYVYDPTQPWVAGTNPRQIFNQLSYEQDRPMDMHGGDGKIFIGTVPGYGKLGGALTIFDIATETYQVKRNIVQDQSIVSLVYKDGKVYGGTSIAGGIGSVATATNAKLFVYDVATDTTTQYALPVSSVKSITSVIVGPDGKIWGMAEGYLFVFNQATNTFEYFQQIFSDITGPKWADATLIVGKFGDVFGTAGGRLFKVLATTKAVTVLDSNGALDLTADEYGNLYYANGAILKRFAY